MKNDVIKYTKKVAKARYDLYYEQLDVNEQNGLLYSYRYYKDKALMSARFMFDNELMDLLPCKISNIDDKYFFIYNDYSLNDTEITSLVVNSLIAIECDTFGNKFRCK